MPSAILLNSGLKSLEQIKEVVSQAVSGPMVLRQVTSSLPRRRAVYVRVSRLLEIMALAHGVGRCERQLEFLGRFDLLVLDDWGLAPLSSEGREDLMEIIDDRHARRSTIITSQPPVDAWHALVGDPTIADAMLDRPSFTTLTASRSAATPCAENHSGSLTTKPNPTNLTTRLFSFVGIDVQLGSV